jgi:hypothetical protein
MKGAIAGTAAAAASALVLLAPAGAANPAPCPDGMIPAPAAAVPSGAKKDKNYNGVVCAKFAPDGTFQGGPDDVTDDIVI